MAKIGSYRHEVMFQSPVYTVTDSGDESITGWSDEGPLWWASVKPLSGREATFAQALQATVSHQVECRYRDDVSSKWRIRINPRGTVDGDGNPVYRYLDIGTVYDVDEMGNVLVCLCTEK